MAYIDVFVLWLADMSGQATTSDGATAASGEGQRDSVQTQLAQLVPTYDPGVDSVETWSQKIRLLLQAWPEGKLVELATRIVYSYNYATLHYTTLHYITLRSLHHHKCNCNCTTKKCTLLWRGARFEFKMYKTLHYTALTTTTITTTATLHDATLH